MQEGALALIFELTFIYDDLFCIYGKYDSDSILKYVRNDPLDQSRQFIATDILSHPRGGEGWDFVAVRVMEIGSDLFCVLSLVFPLGFNIGSGALAHCTFGEVSGVPDS